MQFDVHNEFLDEQSPSLSYFDFPDYSMVPLTSVEKTRYTITQRVQHEATSESIENREK